MRHINLALFSLLSLASLSASAGAVVFHPAHNQSGIVQNPDFTWNPVAGAAAYEIEIAADRDHTRIVMPATRVESPRYVPMQPLTPSATATTYFWRTRAIDADGKPTPWSETRRYNLHAPATTINIHALATLPEIRATLAAAPASALIIFAPETTYRLKPAEGESHALTLENRTDLIIDGNNSLFIIENPTAGAVSMRNCQRVTLRRFRFDCDPLPHSIGVVESINPALATAHESGKKDATITLRRLPGYPDFDAPHMLANWSMGIILDPVIPGRMKAGSPLGVYIANPKITRPSGDKDLFTLTIASAEHGKLFAVRDRVIVLARQHSNSFCLTDSDCADITYDRITIHTSPGLQFSGIGTTGLKILSCNSTPRDTTRFFAGNGDGVHARANLLGPWIEGCTFYGLGDDAIALYNKGMAISTNPAPDKVTIAGTFVHLQPGDSFVIFIPADGKFFGAQRTVTAIKRVEENSDGNSNASAAWQKAAGRADEASSGKRPATAGTWEVTFTPALETKPDFPMGRDNWWENAQLFNRTRVNAGFVIKNNTFISIRRHSVIARATDGLITGNTIIGSSNSAITLINEPNFWGNGLHSERVLIARNRISSSAFDASSAVGGSISVNFRSLADEARGPQPIGKDAATTERLHRNIRIENNTITDWNHLAIFLRSASGCSITGNIITAPAHEDDAIAILADNTADCVIADNIVTPFSAKSISITNSDRTTQK